MPDYTPNETKKTFQAAAEPAAPLKSTVSLDLDADVVAFFQSDTEPENWRQHMNGVLRFYMETQQHLMAGPDWEPIEGEPTRTSAPATPLP